MDAFNELNKAAFESYDPDMSSYDGDSYDPETDTYTPGRNMPMRQAGTNVRVSPARRQGAQKTPDAQFDITITNGQTNALNVELFNAQNTIAEFANNETNFGLVPALSARGINVRNATNTGEEDLIVYGVGFNAATGAGSLISAYWNAAGDLIYTNVAGDPCTISCKQIPYRSLVKYSERGSFKINKMRMKFQTAAQINNDFVWQKKTFLGARASNSISVSSFFRPDQFQSLLVDVPTPISIDAEKGLFYRINAEETLLINMFIGSYTRSAL
jgi:hypothetical protein